MTTAFRPYRHRIDQSRPLSERTWLFHGVEMLTLHPGHLEDDLRLASESGIRGVECEVDQLPQAATLGFDAYSVEVPSGSSMEPLRAIARATHLSVGPAAGEPAIGVNLQDFDRLEVLETTWASDIRFPALRRLRVLGLADYLGKNVQDALLPDELPELRTLYLGHYRPRSKDLASLPAMPELTSIRLSDSALASLQGLDRFRAIEEISVEGDRKLEDIGAVRGLPLRMADFQRCTRLADVSALGDCPTLRVVRLNDCRALASIGFVGRLRNLDEFRMVDSTVADGDMSPLIGVPLVEFDARAHYSHKPTEIRHLSRERSEDGISAPSGEAADASSSVPSVEIDLDTNDTALTAAWADRVPALVTAIRERLAGEPGEAARAYALHHIEQVDADAWTDLGFPTVPSVVELLRRLRPVALWGDPTDVLQLDLSIAEDLTDYVLSFEVHPDGTLGDAMVES